MHKILFVLITLVLHFLNSNTSVSSGVDTLNQNILQNEPKGGIVYISTDNGENWTNSSDGFSEKVSIGLGGIAASNQLLGIATKDKGVYLYNQKSNNWNNIPTDKNIIAANIGALAIVDRVIYVGTQFKGIFFTKDYGKNWSSLNTGLSNLTIRRFCTFNHILYVCTNDGFYFLNNNLNQWKLEFGQNSLQTNGATVFQRRFYLATNKGIFSQQPDRSWINSSPQYSVHNISSDNNQMYAMTYNALLLASQNGKTWNSIQNGLPKELYTFNILHNKNAVFAGQWDGIYKKDSNNIWKLSSSGLPAKFAVTNLIAFQNMLVISTSER